MAVDKAQVAAQAAVAEILEIALAAEDLKTALLASARQHKSRFTHAEVYLIWHDAWNKSQLLGNERVSDEIGNTLEIVAVYGPSAVGILYNESPNAAQLERARNKLGFG